MRAIGETVRSAIRRTAVTAAAIALVGATAVGLGLHARHASGATAPRAALPAAASPVDPVRPSWSLAGFRDQETWRETSPSPDAY